MFWCEMCGNVYRVGVYFIVLVGLAGGANLAKLGAEIKGLGDISCVSERDCAPNAYCIDSRYCMCKDDFVQDSATQTCLPKAKRINEPCTIDIQCTSSFGTLATCSKPMFSPTGQCRCLPTAHFQDNLCYQSVHLGGPCKVSDNCISTSNVPTYCAHSVCVCAGGFHPSDDHQDCLPDVALNETCRKDEDCVAENSYCSGICTCQPNFVSSKSGRRCLLAAKSLRAPCDEDSQCSHHLPNTLCDVQDYRCKCTSFSHELDNSCWVSSKLGEVCNHPNQCVTTSHNRSVVVCSEGRCACADSHRRVGGNCEYFKEKIVKSHANRTVCISLFSTLLSILFLNSFHDFFSL